MMPIEEIFNRDADDGKTNVLGVDEQNRLYWNGEPIMTEKKITLQWWVNLAVVVGSIGAIAQAIFAGFSYFKGH